jgi:hypothetical protein
MYYVLSQFTDKTVDTKYTAKDDANSWRVWNSGTYDFNITTRTDTYSQADFTYEEWNYIDSSITTYYDVSQSQYFKLTFDNPNGANQGEFWLNVSANKVATLKMSINGYDHTTSVTTDWIVKKIYTDDLVAGTNTIYFQVHGISDAHIYIKNATTNSNLTFYVSDPFLDYVEITSGTIGIDVIFCDFIFKREIEKYSTDTLKQITAGNNDIWDMAYYPSVNTDDSYVRIQFDIYNLAGRYLDNFTAVFRFECKLYVDISQNVTSITFYRGETTEFSITFTNSGGSDTIISNTTTSLTWVVAKSDTGYSGVSIIAGSSTTLTFIATPGADEDQTSYYMYILMSGTNDMGHIGTVRVYLESRASISVDQTDFTDLERDEGEDLTFWFTITNDGIGDADIDISWDYTGSGGAFATLSLVNDSHSSFTLAPGEVTIGFVISGDVPDTFDEWTITIEESTSNATITIDVSCTTSGDKRGAWQILLFIIASISIMIAGTFTMKPNKSYKRHWLQRKEYLAKNEFVEADASNKKIPWHYKLRYGIGAIIIVIGAVILGWAIMQVWQGYAENPFKDLNFTSEF